MKICVVSVEKGTDASLKSASFVFSNGFARILIILKIGILTI